MGARVSVGEWKFGSGHVLPRGSYTVSAERFHAYCVFYLLLGGVALVVVGRRTGRRAIVAVAEANSALDSLGDSHSGWVYGMVVE